MKIVRQRRGADLAEWLSDAEASGIREIQQFACRVRQDEAAVLAGCTLVYSNRFSTVMDNPFWYLPLPEVRPSCA